MADTYDVTQPNVNLPMIGEPRPRYEARAKVTGETRYAADEPLAGTLYAQLVTASEPRGRITVLDTSAAEAVPGVRLVLTYKNVRATPNSDPLTLGGPMQSSFYPLAGSWYGSQIRGSDRRAGRR